LKVPKRSEVIVRIPVEYGVEGADGLIEKTEITRGVYLASSLIRIDGEQTITSILNTNETDVVVEIPAIQWEEYKTGEEEGSQKYIGSVALMKRERIQNRAHKVLEKLRLENLNPEERQVMEDTCRDYHDIFYLPGDTLSCTTTVKHFISVIPGMSPINTRPYRLPESQKAKVDKQVYKLLKEGVITESNSPWCSPLLVVPKKTDASGEKKWRLVVDFRKLNEKTIGDAYPFPDITKTLDQLGQSKFCPRVCCLKT
jgi:hypothetical protein